MNIDQFLTDFPLLAEAPNGVPKLREMILQLAVQGKLVPQDPKDESASVLLEKVKAEKTRLVADRKIRKPKPGPPIEADDMHYKLPARWTWVRIGDFLDFNYGKGIPKINRVSSGDVPIYGANGILGYHDTALIEQECIIVGRKGSAGALNRVYGPCWPSDVTFFVFPPNGTAFEYIYLLLKSLNLENFAKGIKPGLNRNTAYRLVTSLPPLAEQHRIVAKVDELMVRCDELESQQNKRNSVSISLNDASLHELTSPQTPKQFSEAAQRIFDNFDLLYDDPENVKKLRKAILQLAVQGRLALQDTNDEPASVLLEKIKAEKARLIAEGKIKKQKPLLPIMENEVPYELPEGWVWARTGDIAIVRGGKRIPKGMSYASYETNHIYIRVKDMKQGTIIDSDLHYISGTVFEQIAKYTISTNDLYITIAGTIGVVGEVPGRFDGMNLTENAAKLTFRRMDKKYFKLALNSEVLQKQFEKSTRQMAQPKLALVRIQNAIVPLPSLAEQHCIVAKVDELMGLCDALEEELVQANGDAERMMEAVVHEMGGGA